MLKEIITLTVTAKDETGNVVACAVVPIELDKGKNGKVHVLPVVTYPEIEETATDG